MAKVYIGDIGTVLKITTGYDFSVDTSATCTLKVLRPGDTTVYDWDATISSTASEKAAGVVRHYIDPANLNGAGTYKLQAFIEAGDSTNQWYGQVAQWVIHSLWT